MTAEYEERRLIYRSRVKNQNRGCLPFGRSGKLDPTWGEPIHPMNIVPHPRVGGLYYVFDPERHEWVYAMPMIGEEGVLESDGGVVDPMYVSYAREMLARRN